jgi:GLPGLI family protein
MELKVSFLRQIILIVIFAFSNVGCKNFVTTSSIDEGEIEYDLKVIDNRNPLLANDMLPSTMTMSFKDNNTCFSLSAFGVFATDLVSNNKTKTLIQTLKLMGKKYAVFANQDSIRSYLKNEPSMLIEHTNKTKIIAGYNCKHAKCTFQNPDFPSFDVYYTEDIKIEDPNFYSQYAPIKGVLMEFNVYRYNVFMKLSAKQVNKKDIDDDLFEAIKDFKMVGKKEMDSYFSPTL